ncbi:SigE family RNA polymerase sigma factor [Streptomyces sp. 549]|uniref:SigE family RNA polymerase sigma factor n=1 Tax=Streptomyces sp. 549 TaxID=3049076 RepID=UPI0024C35585|nr:SigE family RNA polymerase sigma factor [Streptomyces sp. 549]MDK1473367.1 SigE family RNA polymerase sigma factor [Streptomyces sp. 549]
MDRRVDDVNHVGHVDEAAEFHEFFELHYRELARFARLLTGEADAADDLAAEALLALWHRWDRARRADRPVAYARGVVANLARSRVRSTVRERRRIALFWPPCDSGDGVCDDGPDVPAVVDVQGALRRLPFRKRACVVLRHAFDLSERDTSLVLGISVGTVKSQTSRGVAELQRLLDPQEASAACVPAPLVQFAAVRPPVRPVARSAVHPRLVVAARPEIESSRSPH